jgi:isopentenyl phosphate kinase
VVRIVKLGGSVITDKGGAMKVRADVLARLAREIADAGRDIVVVHGAGSFGHPLAREQNLAFGLLDDKAPRAASQVHADVRRLNLAVLDALRDAGMNPVTFSPWGLYACSDGTSGGWNFVPFHRTLGMGFTPVTHGDVVLDTSRSITVLSGDRLVAAMAQFFRADRVVFAIDQDGVYDKLPTMPGAQILKEPTARELEKARVMSSAGAMADATGSMSGKLAAVKTIVESGIEVSLVNGLVAGRVREALEGKGTGTIARPEADP